PSTVTRIDVASDAPARFAFRILRFGFALLPIIAGADKFFDRFVDWEQYLAPAVASRLPVSPHAFMALVGVIEIVAGILVAMRPRLGATIVAFWLWGIIVNLLLTHGYYDVALRDFGLSLGALALARL